MQEFWASAVNQCGGLLYIIPIKCDKVANYDSNLFWDKDGDISVNIKELGMKQYSDGYIQFSSKNRKEVELWISGAKAVIEMIKNFCG